MQRRGELAEWLPRDPLRRLADQLIERGVADLALREQAIDARIGRAVEAARSAPQPAPERLIEHVWQEAVCAR